MDKNVAVNVRQSSLSFSTYLQAETTKKLQPHLINRPKLYS